MKKEMKTKCEDRIAKLMDVLQKSENLHLKDAAKLLGVSEMTVRRDITQFSSPLTLLGGYIVILPEHKHSQHYFVSDQQSKQISEKLHIGKVAASLIEDNDTVFFDCGTTTPFIIDCIPDDCHFTALCYSLNAFIALQKKSHCQIILCGGEFKTDNAIFLPLANDSLLDDICPNKAFISAAGITIKGVTCFNFNELSVKKRVIEKSMQTILVADSSKFGMTKPAFLGGFELFDAIITDDMNDDFKRYFQEKQIPVYLS